MKDMIKRKLKCEGYVPRGSNALSDLQILEGRMVGKKKVGRTWMKNMDEGFI